MPDETDATHHIVGGGVAGLSAAVLLIRDAGVGGARIRIYEALDTLGGSLDGSGDAERGFLTRGGRMFEENFVCTLDLLATIPAPDDPSISVRDDILAFNEEMRSSSRCRLARDGAPAEDRDHLTLGAQDTLDLNRLFLTPEGRLEHADIASWFRPEFFETNFWSMWSTMFSFQPWHSLIEMRRYMRRFLHLLPGLTRIEGVLRTRYNQYDSVVVPMRDWLAARGVVFLTDGAVEDVAIEGDMSARRVVALTLENGETVAVGGEDRVYLTLGSMTDNTRTGDNAAPPPIDDSEGPAWRLWRRIAARHEGFGRPTAFCAEPNRTAWTSFTVTLGGRGFLDFMEAFTGNPTGTGGLVSFDRSGWMLSVVMLGQPHFRAQPEGSFVFWGYGLRGERDGDFVRKPMAQASGDEILAELAGQLRLDAAQRAWFDRARVIPCRMPFITSQFMPRHKGDRPPVRPRGARNFAVIGQFCEMPRDCVFTVEYSVRSAWAAVAEMTGRVSAPPPVRRSDRDPVALLHAAQTLLLD